MIEATTNRQLSLGLPRDEHAPRIESRMEPREQTVRRVEYSAFPRVGNDTGASIGFTRNASPSGMAVGVEEPLAVGTLLRVLVQRADGRPDFDAVARVAWCHESPDARPAEARAAGRGGAGWGPHAAPHSWLGLVLVAEVRRGLTRVPRSTALPMRRSA